MSIKAIDEIVKKSTSKSKGYFTSVFTWLIPKKHISKGVKLLKRQDSTHLKSLIKFNEEVRSALLFETLRVENYLNTVIFNNFKKKKFEDLDEIIFASEDKQKKMLEIVSKNPKYKEMDFDELFELFTFGVKVEIISCFSEAVLRKLFYKDTRFSKKEYHKILRLVVEIRNKVAHQSFVAYPEFVWGMIVQPGPDWKGTVSDYFFNRIDQINCIYGRPGFKDRIRNITIKYQNHLLLENII